jgi:hypothetical protein
LTFADYYRQRRNQQGIENKLIEPPMSLPEVGHIQCRKELGRDAELLSSSGSRINHNFSTSAQFFGITGYTTGYDTSG